MGVYVDPLKDHGWKIHGRWVLSCHLFTDGPAEELHALAEKIGLKREWFQEARDGTPHYDLTVKMRVAAIRAGAEQVSVRKAVEIWRERRRIARE